MTKTFELFNSFRMMFVLVMEVYKDTLDSCQEIVTQNKNVTNLELEQPLLEVVQKAMASAVFVIIFERG